MEEKIRQGNLFDFYGDLLKEQHRRVVYMYVCEDLSLSEIANQEGMSRQGVHDCIKRATARMEDFESSLHLIDRFSFMRQRLERVKDISDDEEIKSLINELLEEL